MNDLGSYRVPREADVGREVRFEQRRAVNRNALFAIGGLLLLCVCMCLGVALLASQLGSPLAGIQVNLFDEPATATPRASARGTPTLVPYGRAVRSDNGLRVTVTSFQRPLPTEGVEIPDG